MARGITVKVAKDKVVKALKAKLDAGAKAVVSNEKKRKDYVKIEATWAKEVAELIVKNISKAEISADENWRGEVNARFTIPANVIKLPAKPEMGLENELGRYEVQEIENAIRILEMSDEEFVSASTMKQIAQYL